MAPINWVQYNERVVGENSPDYDDVDNRPLKEIFTASNLTSVEDFPGFIPTYRGAGTPEGVQVSEPGRLFFRTDTGSLYLKATGSGLLGWIGIGSPTGTPDFIAKFNAAGTNVEASIMSQVSGCIIVGTDPEATATELLRTAGGFISEGAGNDSFIAGRGAIVKAANAIAIGTGVSIANVGSTVNDAVVIGNGSFTQAGSVATTALKTVVIIGPRNTITSNQTGGFQPVDDMIVIGSRNNLTNTIGGTYQNNIVIGNGIIVNAMGDSIILGNIDTTLPLPNQFNGLVVGNGARIDAGSNLMMFGTSCRNVSGNDNLIIGRGAIKTAGGGGQENIIIGTIASIAQTDYAIVIGSTSQIGSGFTGCIAIGRQSNIQFTNCLAIAPGATPNAANQCILGSNFTGGDYREFIFGQGPDQVTGAISTKWRTSNGFGSNIAIGNLIIQAGLATGNAVSAAILFQTSAAPLGSGSTVQTAFTRLTIFAPTAVSAYTAMYSPTAIDNAFRFEINAVVLAYVGVAGAAGGIITGSTAGDTCVRSENGNIRFSVTAGATIQWSIVAAGHFIVGVDNTYDIGTATGPLRPKDIRLAGVIYTGVAAFFHRTTIALTDGAAAAAGTLANAPAAGNPTKWIGIDDNGTTRYVPAW